MISKFANMLVGIDGGTGVGHSLMSCTTDITAFRYQSGSYSVVLIDTPGFNDTTMTDYEVLRRITDWLASTYRRSVTLSGVLYFHRISDNRMTGTERRNIDMFRSLVGNKALMNVIIVSTMWDMFKTEVGADMEARLVNGYWKEMVDKKARVVRHYNDTASARSIVGMLLEMTRSPLLVQEEIVKQGKSLPDTSVGRRFATWVTDVRKVAQKAVFKLERREKMEGTSTALRQEKEAQLKIKEEAEEFEQGLATRFRRWIGVDPAPTIPAPVPAEGAQDLRPQIPSLSALKCLPESRGSVPPVAQSPAPQMSQATSTSSNTSTIPSPIHSMSRNEIPGHCLKCLKWVKALPKSGLPDALDELVTLGIQIANTVQVRVVHH
ncbi:hypothetical protein BJ165DRAFT_1347421 [Panaeolus papilionaceus]|nr:hypothetical protein BJ165DRAFT_1347421 [Panaeolus papilionaceus]